MTPVFPDPFEPKLAENRSQDISPPLTPAPPATQPDRMALVPGWRLWAPLLLQSLLILGVPAQAVYTQLTGQTVILQTVPVDPYDLLRGYYVTLAYDVSQIESLRRLQGWQKLTERFENSHHLPENTRLYVVLQAPATTNSQPPQPWQPVAVSPDLPTNLPANQIALRGSVRYNRVIYGLEEYYIPEEQRQEINGAIAAAQTQQRRENHTSPIVVETKVDAQGRAVPLSFWVTLGKGPGQQTHRYQF